MSDLRAGHREVHVAFRNRFYGLKTQTGSPRQKNYLSAHWPDSTEDLNALEKITDDGLMQFREIFGYSSTCFVGCNYVWPAEFEPFLAARGVKLMQTQRGHAQPDPKRSGKIRICRHYTGETNRYGQHYAVRNVLFEPYLDENADWARRALREVSQSFSLGKPAVVSSHRINFVGGMDMAHRDRNLRHLSKFLDFVRNRWPEVEFTTSDELAEIMQAEA